MVDDTVCVENDHDTVCVENNHDDTACGEKAYTVCESQLGSDHYVKANALVVKPPKFKVGFKDCSVTMVADSGASCSIIDEKTFKNKFKGIQLEKCSTDKLNVYGGSCIVTTGCFTATIKCGKQTASDMFYVVKGNCGNILSVKLSQKTWFADSRRACS